MIDGVSVEGKVEGASVGCKVVGGSGDRELSPDGSKVVGGSVVPTSSSGKNVGKRVDGKAV